jgi:hypothetical protein
LDEDRLVYPSADAGDDWATRAKSRTVEGIKMKPSKIEVGKTYVNKGKGTTQRKVLDIGFHIKPTEWYSSNDPPEEPGVYFEQRGMGGRKFDRLYISSFASWVGREVE